MMGMQNLCTLFGPTLLEKRGSLGGRTIAIPQPAVDDIPDNGQHVFASGYEYLLRFLDSVGTRQHVCFPGHMGVRMPGGEFRQTAFWGLGGLRIALGDLPGVHGLDKLRTARSQFTCHSIAPKGPFNCTGTLTPLSSIISGPARPLAVLTTRVRSR